MIALTLLLACRNDKVDDTAGDTATDTSASTPAVSIELRTGRTDRDGYVDVEVEVGPDELFQVMTRRNRGWMSTDYIYGPDGSAALDWEDWYEAPRSLTSCFFPSKVATTVNWPVREEDGPLAQGTWTVRAAALTGQLEYESGVDIDIAVLKRKDTDFTRGSLRVVVSYTEGLRDDPEVVRGTEAAVDYWTQLYASQGITMSVTYQDIATDPDLPDTYQGLAELESFGAGLAEPSVIVVIGDSIAGSSDAIYGEAGGIPGPYRPSPSGAVFASWLANAGGDAVFQPPDILIYGETLAHEVGHYLGLFHPVEDGYQNWDALGDTTECRAWGACDDALGANLMYPYPVCTGYAAATCGRQDQLSAQQGGVLHRWIGVE